MSSPGLVFQEWKQLGTESTGLGGDPGPPVPAELPWHFPQFWDSLHVAFLQGRSRWDERGRCPTVKVGETEAPLFLKSLQ